MQLGTENKGNSCPPGKTREPNLRKSRYVPNLNTGSQEAARAVASRCPPDKKCSIILKSLEFPKMFGILPKISEILPDFLKSSRKSLEISGILPEISEILTEISGILPEISGILLKSLKSSLKSLNSSRKSLESSLKSLKSSLKSLKSSLKSLKSSRKSLESSLKSLKSSRKSRIPPKMSGILPEISEILLKSLKSSRKSLKSSLKSLESSLKSLKSSLESLKSSKSLESSRKSLESSLKSLESSLKDYPKLSRASFGVSTLNKKFKLCWTLRSGSDCFGRGYEGRRRGFTTYSQVTTGDIGDGFFLPVGWLVPFGDGPLLLWVYRHPMSDAEFKFGPQSRIFWISFYFQEVLDHFFRLVYFAQPGVLWV